jgi:hypothetical protein
MEDLTPAEARRERRNSWIAFTAFTTGITGVLVATFFLYRAADGQPFPPTADVGTIESVCAIDVAALP